MATGLPALPAFVQALDGELVRAQRQSHSLAVLFVRFTDLEALGDKAFDADYMLRGAAKALTNGCREYDTVARMGEDALGIIFPGMKIEALGEKIEALQAEILSQLPRRAALAPPLFHFGWAIYPDDAATSKLLLAIAERRSDMQTGGVAENLLALHSHYSQELDSPDAAVPRTAEPSEKARS
jgi:GGDEF domain-containing protein